MGSDKVSIKEDPLAIYIGFFRHCSARLGARTKMHMQTQSVGGNDNFWQTLDGSNNNPFDCCSLKSRSPRVITASLSRKADALLVDAFFSENLHIQHHIQADHKKI